VLAPGITPRQGSLLKGTPAKFLGYIEAPDEKAAIDAAAEGIQDRRGAAGPDRCAATGTSAPASAFFRKSRPIMLNLSISVDDPGCVKTLYFIMIGVIPAI
jgi:hypothetical protein